jgi:hypothetical protein
MIQGIHPILNSWHLHFFLFTLPMCLPTFEYDGPEFLEPGK